MNNMSGKGDKRRPELVIGSYRKNYIRIFRDNQKSVENRKQELIKDKK